MGRQAHHDPAIFDNGKALALYHTKRLASPGQRLVLYASKRRRLTCENVCAPDFSTR
jgi:hypothetical protein